jgi:hypothetical protein
MRYRQQPPDNSSSCPASTTCIAPPQATLYLSRMFAPSWFVCYCPPSPFHYPPSARYAASKNSRSFLDVASSEQWLGYTSQDNADDAFVAKGLA